MSLKKACLVLLSAFVVTAPLWLPSFAFAEDVQCNGWPGNWGNCFMVGIAYLLNTIVAAVAYLLYLAGTILEYTLQFTIYTPYNNIEAIKAGWTLLRDLINLVFIFLLLYVAIATILKADNTTWRRQVVQIIVAAILINFSLFITRVVIDAGNILAIQFYEQVTTCAVGAANCESGEIGINEAFMRGLGLQEAFSANAFGEDVSASTAGQSIRNSLIRLVLIIVAAWAFLIAAILFLARTVAIVFLLVLSPIGLAGANIPILSKHSKTWRETLFAQTFVPAVFLFFIFLLLALIGESGVFRSEEGVVGTGGVDTEDGSLNAEYFFNFIIIVAFIIAAVRITKSLSGQVGKVMDGVVKTAAGVGIGLATGGAALAGRQTLGRAATATLSSKRGEKLKEEAESGNQFALNRYNRLKSMSSGSFDVRQTAVGGFAAKQAGKNFGSLAGISATTGMAAAKGGRAQRIKDNVEREEKKVEDLSPEGVRKWADKHKEKGAVLKSGIAAGTHQAAAKKLSQMADRKETSKEERERRVGGVAGNIRKNATDESEVKKQLGTLRSSELRDLPPDVLKNENVIKNLEIGDVEQLKGNLNRADLEEIVQSSHLQPHVKDWIDNPDHGFPTSGRQRPTQSASNAKRSNLLDQYGRPL